MVISFISLFLATLLQKTIAEKYHATCNYELWYEQSGKNIRMWPVILRKTRMQLGIILSLVLILLSNGAIKFSALGTQKIEAIRKLRARKKYEELSDFETALIATTAPIFHMLIALILTIFSTPLIENIIFLNYSIALYSLLPFPRLAGGRLFLSSPIIFIITVVLMFLAYASIAAASIPFSILMSIVGILSLIAIFRY